MITILYSKTSTGDIQMWSCSIAGNKIFVEYGLIDGKKQESVKVIKEGKNIGKSNETTPEEQAQIKYNSMVNDKIRKGYFHTLEEAEENLYLSPMLAKKWEDHKHKFLSMDKPFIVEAKIDGVRCLSIYNPKTGAIKLQSRGNKEYDIPHIKDQLNILYNKLGVLNENVILDGELFISEENFETIASAVKKIGPNTGRVIYILYDVILLDDLDMKCKDRKDFLDRIKKHQMSYKYASQMKDIHLVKTDLAYNEADVEDLIDYYVSEKGMEGAIIRHPDGKYKIDGRSDQLLKYKKFVDEEFLVVDINAGVDKFENVGIFTCETKDGIRFKATPDGTQKQREKYLTNKKDYIGQYVTVRYFELTLDGIPRFPVAVGFRPQHEINTSK